MIFSGQYGLPGRGRTGSLWSRSPTHYPLCYGQFPNITSLFYHKIKIFASFFTLPKAKNFRLLY